MGLHDLVFVFYFFFISFTFSIMFVAKRRNRADRPVLVMALCYVI